MKSLQLPIKSTLTSLINNYYKAGKDLGNYIAELETCFNWLGVMDLPVAEEIQIAILLVSVINESLKGTDAALKNVDGNKAPWDTI